MVKTKFMKKEKIDKQIVQDNAVQVSRASGGAGVMGAATGPSRRVSILKRTLVEMKLWNKCPATWTCLLAVFTAIANAAEPGVGDDVMPIQVRLGVLSTGGYELVQCRRAGLPREWEGYAPRIALETNKPAALRRAPSGLEAPLYGEFTLGSSEHPATFTVLVDEPDGKPARLWVDRNGNGDLTDDPLIEWTFRRKRNPYPMEPDYTTGYYGQATFLIQDGGQPLEFGVKMRRWTKDHPDFEQYGNVLSSNREYAPTGYVTLHGKSIRAALDDEKVRGDFRGATNEPESGVYLLLDLNGDGRFVQRGERFDVRKPFNIAGTTYEITEMSPLGESFKIVKSQHTVSEVPILPDFVVGVKIPPFEKTTLAGRKLNFPADYKGKLVLIDFWATWCSPCVAEEPNLRVAYTNFHDQGFEILGVSQDFPGVREMLVNYTKDMPWPQIYEGGSEGLPRYFGVRGIPYWLLVDGDTGEILATSDDMRRRPKETTILTPTQFPGLTATLQEAFKKKAAKIGK